MPEEPEDAPVVICTELAEGNGGISVTNCAEVLAAKVIEANRLQLNPVWIEHYEHGARGTPENPHTFDLVIFAGYEVEHLGSSYLGEHRRRQGSSPASSTPGRWPRFC